MRIKAWIIAAAACAGLAACGDTFQEQALIGGGARCCDRSGSGRQTIHRRSLGGSGQLALLPDQPKQMQLRGALPLTH